MTAASIRKRLDRGQPYEPAPWPTPDLSLLSHGNRSPPPLPIAVFGAWSHHLQRMAEGCAAPLDYVASSLLAVAAGLIGNARRISPWPSWEEPPILWLAIVGSPSSGKSPAMSPLTRLLAQLEAEDAPRHDEALRIWETHKVGAERRKEIWQDEVNTALKNSIPPPIKPADAEPPPRPARRRLSVSDTTQEAIGEILAGQPNGTVMIRDELAAFLASFDRYSGKSGGDRAFWLECWGGRSHVIDRVKHGGKPIVIPHLGVGILGGIQPDRLSSLLLSGDDDGLAARFLLSWPEPVPRNRPATEPDMPAMLAALRRLMSLDMPSAHDKPMPVTLPLSAAARDAFERWWKGNETVSHETGLLAGFRGKMPGQCLRLALVLELLWWSIGPRPSPPAEVGLQALESAIAMLDGYFLPMALRCYGDAARPAAEHDAARLAQWLRRERPSVFNARALGRSYALTGLSDRSARDAAIVVLIEADILRPAPVATQTGRRRVDYEVNPGLWSSP